MALSVWKCLRSSAIHHPVPSLRSTRIAFLLLVALFAIPLVQSQSVPTNGTPNFTGYSGGPDVINDANLNIHYTIPVFSRAGAGLPFSLSLPVDNGAWYLNVKTQNGYIDYYWNYDPSTGQPGVDLPPKMRQPVKRQNPWNGENESWDCLAGGLLGSSSSPRSSGWNRAFQSRK